jgi:hypothetical protein
MVDANRSPCTLCDRTPDEGGLFLVAPNGITICERCIRDLYWRVQEEHRPGYLWRAMGLHRTRAERDTRFMLAVVPALVLAWVVTPTLRAAIAFLSSFGWRAEAILVLLALIAVFLPMFVVVADRALSRNVGSQILLWAAWTIAGGVIWWPAGWPAALGGAVSAVTLLYFVVRRASSSQQDAAGASASGP